MKLDPNTARLILEIVIAVLTILGVVFGWFKSLYRFITGLLRKRPEGQIAVPKKTMILIPDTHEFAFNWSEGKIGDEPAMLVSGHFTATNISEFGVRAIALKVKEKVNHPMVMMRNPKSNVYGAFMLPHGNLSDISFNFWITPPTKVKGEPLTTSVAIIDQFGNEHWVKDLEFKSL